MTGLLSNTFAVAILAALISVGAIGLVLLAKRSSSPRWIGGLLVVESGLFLVIFLSLSTELLIPTPPITLAVRDIIPLIPALVGSLIGVAGLAGLYLVGKESRLRNVQAGSWVVFSVALIGFFGFLIIAVWAAPSIEEAIPLPTPSLTPQPTPVPHIELIAPTLPEGFRVEAVTPRGFFNRPTSMTFGEDGELYVGSTDGIAILDYATEGGEVGESKAFAGGVSSPLGLVFQDGSLYASSEGTIVRIEDLDGDRDADSIEILFDGLPHFVYEVHSNNGLAFGLDGRLYVGLGGTSDHGPEDHPFAGSILVSELGGAPLEIFATGFRNPYDLAFCSDGRLYATDNGPDQITDESLVYFPPDELNLVEAGADYGYPVSYGYPPDWSDSIGPIALLPARAGVTGIACYEGGQFPEEFEGDLFTTTWASSQLIHIELDEQAEHTTGTISYFAEGWGQPIDIVVDSEGALLILDWHLGQIFRITYGG